MTTLDRTQLFNQDLTSTAGSCGTPLFSRSLWSEVPFQIAPSLPHRGQRFPFQQHLGIKASFRRIITTSTVHHLMVWFPYVTCVSIRDRYPCEACESGCCVRVGVQGRHQPRLMSWCPQPDVGPAPLQLNMTERVLNAKMPFRLLYGCDEMKNIVVGGVFFPLSLLDCINLYVRTVLCKYRKHVSRNLLITTKTTLLSMWTSIYMKRQDLISPIVSPGVDEWIIIIDATITIITTISQGHVRRQHDKG